MCEAEVTSRIFFQPRWCAKGSRGREHSADFGVRLAALQSGTKVMGKVAEALEKCDNWQDAH